MKLNPGHAAALIAITFTIAATREGTISHGWMDNALFVAAAVFIWWLISDFSSLRQGRGVDPQNGDSLRQGIAFRLGKALQRARRKRVSR